MYYDLLMPLLEHFEQNIFSYNIYSGDMLKNDRFRDIKKNSIYILNYEKEIDVQWINDIKIFVKENKENLIPFEAVMVLNDEFNKMVSYINNRKRMGDLKIINDERAQKILNNYKTYNDKIFEILYKRNFYNISGEFLEIYIDRISNYTNKKFNENYLFKAIRYKIKNLKKIEKEFTDYKEKSYLLKCKKKEIKTYEVFEYVNGCSNYFFLAEGEIEFSKIDDNKVLYTLKNENSSECYSVFFDVFNNNKNQELMLNDFERVLFWGAVEEIKNRKNLVSVKDNIKKFILSKQGYFEYEYFKEIIAIWYENEIKISNHIKELEKNPTNENLKIIIRSCSSAEEIFYVMRNAEIKVKNISIDNYVESIIRLYERLDEDKNNISMWYAIALYIEELIPKKPIIFEEQIEILKKIYASEDKDIFTENTVDALRYINHAVKDEEIIENAFLKVKYKKNEFDTEMLEKLYKNKEKGNYELIDKITNKLIYTVEDFSIYDKNIIIDLVYDFYKRYNDLNALKKLCRYLVKSRISLKESYINTEDIKKIINDILKSNYICSDNESRLRILYEYKNDKLVLEGIKKVIEGIYDIEDLENIKDKYIVENNYKEFLIDMRKQNENIYRYYLELILKNMNNIQNLSYDEVKELEKKLNKVTVNTDIKRKINLILVLYYMNELNEEKIGYYLKMYMKAYNSKSNDLLTCVLRKYIDNMDIIEIVLNKVDFIRLDNADVHLKRIFDSILKNNRLDLINCILKYYIFKEKYLLSKEIIRKYLINSDNIDHSIYREFIIVILDNIPFEDKKEIFKLMSRRKDLPIDIREKYYIILYDKEKSSEEESEYNKNIIIEAFLKCETKSELAQRFALEKYFNDDKLFIDIINNRPNIKNKFIEEILKSKLREKFTNDKSYVKELLKNVKTNSNEIRIIAEYTKAYFNNDERYIIGDYKVTNYIKGDFIRLVSLKNIFNEKDVKEAFEIADYKVLNVILNYFDEIEINYIKLDESTYYINEKKSNKVNEYISMEKFIKCVKKLIVLQKQLISVGAIISRFDKINLKFDNSGFIINSQRGISQYKEGLKIKVDFYVNEEIKKLENGKYITLNEKNLCEIMKIYIKEILEDLDLSDENERIKSNFITKVLEADIISYDLFIGQIDKFIKEKKKKFEEITFFERLRKFKDFDKEERKEILKNILDRLDMTNIAKEIVISEINNFEKYNFNRHYYINYILYLIECFNESYSEIGIKYLTEIYDFVSENINEILCDIWEENGNTIKSFFINANEKTHIDKEDIRESVKILYISDKDKNYILKKI